MKAQRGVVEITEIVPCADKRMNLVRTILKFSLVRRSVVYGLDCALLIFPFSSRRAESS